MRYTLRRIAAITAFLIIILASGCGEADAPPDVATGGFADLSREMSFGRIIELNGEWDFYPGRFISPGDFNSKNSGEKVYLKVPGDWNSIQHAKGYGTYRLKVRLPDDYPPCSMKLIWVKSVAKVWIDDRLLVEQGVITDPVEGSLPGEYISIADFRPLNADFYITIHAANYHDRRGGLCYPVSMAPPTVMYNNEMRATFINTFIIGALVIVILFHVALHFYFRAFSLNLYVSVICLMALIRIFILTDSIYIFSFVKDLGYTLLVKIEFAGLILAFIFLLQFFTKLYLPGENRILKRALYWSGIASVLYVSAVSDYNVKVALPVFQIYLLAVTIYILVSPLREGLKKRSSGAGIYTAAVILALAGFINDIIFFLTSRGYPNVSVFMFFVFLVGHFVVISIYFSEVFRRNIFLKEEIDLKQKTVKNLNLISATDPLTGIFNRRFFDSYLGAKIKEYNRGDQLWLIIFDIDFFKKVNDEFGHSMGDLILKEISSLVKGLIRTGDIFCRWGGEEFALIIEGMDKDTIRQFTDRLRESVESFNFSTGACITASFGVTHFLSGESAGDFIHRADKALYQAKGSGRNRVVFA